MKIENVPTQYKSQSVLGLFGQSEVIMVIIIESYTRRVKFDRFFKGNIKM